MSFESTYQLVSPIADSAEALSYKAVMKMTGEEVWIHIIRTDARELFSMAKRQHASGGFGDKPILEVVEEGSKTYIVTRPLPGGASLRDWLSTLGQAKTPDPMQKAGVFKFDGLAAPPLPPPPAMATQVLPVYPPQTAPVPPPPPPMQEPGEFTRMFKTPSVQPPAAPPAQAPDDFSQMFSASQLAPPPSPFDSLFPPASQSSPAAPPDADEFNRMFQSPLMQHTPAPVNPLTNPIAPPPSQKEGEFTRMFKSVAPSEMLPSSAPPPPPPTPSAGPGDFTRMLKTPSFGGSTAVPQAASPIPAAPQSFNPQSATPPAYGAPPPGPTPAPFGGPQQAPPPASPPSGGGSRPLDNIIQAPSFQKPTLSGPSFRAPSANMSGMSGPSISASGKITGPSMGTPSFSEGQMYAPSVAGQGLSAPSIRPQSLGGSHFSLDNLPGFGAGSAPSASPDVAPPAAGPLSSSGGAMNPNALSSPDGATGFFRAPAAPPQQGAPPPQASGPGDFTRMMKAPPVASAPAVGVPVPQSNAPAAGRAPLLSNPAAPAIPSSAPPAVVPAAPAPATAASFFKGISPWVIVGNVVIILMIVVLIYVIMKSSR